METGFSIHCIEGHAQGKSGSLVVHYVSFSNFNIYYSLNFLRFVSRFGILSEKQLNYLDKVVHCMFLVAELVGIESVTVTVTRIANDLEYLKGDMLNY